MTDDAERDTRCSICGDPNVYRIWIGPKPDGCPFGDHVKSVTDCPDQMARAKAQADLRKFCPEAFDENGKIKADGWAIIAAKAERT